MIVERKNWSSTHYPMRGAGLVLFDDDPVSGPTMHRLLGAETDLHMARIPFPAGDNGLEASLRAAAASLLPSAPPSVIGFACTTGAVRLGAPRLRAAFARPGCTIMAADPIHAALAACRAMGLRRIALISPYDEEQSRMVAGALSSQGLDIPWLGHFDATDADITSISAESIRAAARSAKVHRPDAIFLSCTGLRAVPLIDELESELEIMVLTSLQLLAWQMATLLRLHPAGPGRLMRNTMWTTNP